MKINEVLQCKFPSASFSNDIILQDDGQGIYIKYWNPSLGDQPTTDQLSAWQNDAALIQVYTYKQNAIANIPILDQLEELDRQSIRAMREPSDASTAKLQILTAQAATLRAQILPTS